jgi:hypothetical protein
MTRALVHMMHDSSQPFVLELDASGTFGIGDFLMHGDMPVSFMINAIGPKAAALSTYDKVALAVIEAVKKWKHYFAISSLIIKTHQHELKYI